MTAALLLASRCLLATWSGFVGSHPATCRLCTGVVNESANLAEVAGRCHIPQFGRHRLFAVGLVSPARIPMVGGSGAICRRHAPPHFGPPPCVPPAPCPPPYVPPWCCALMPSPVTFDVANPPTAVEGTYVCPTESGAFRLSR